MTTFQDVIMACESKRKELAMAGGGGYVMPHGEAYYRTQLQSRPELIDEMLSTYREQREKACGRKSLYLLMDEELDAYSRAAVEAKVKDEVKTVVPEVVMDLPTVVPDNPVVIPEQVLPARQYQLNNYYLAPNPLDLDKNTNSYRKNRKPVTDEYDVMAIVNDVRKRVNYVNYAGKTYLFLQTIKGDPDSTAWVSRTHGEIVSHLQWLYEKEVEAIGSLKVLNEVAKFMMRDLTHNVESIDYLKIKSRVQFLGSYYDLNQRRWFSNSPRDFFTIYINVRGTDVQNWKGTLRTFPVMMDNITRGDERTSAAILEMLATCISQTLEYKGAFFLGGPTDSGKSTLIHLVESFYTPALKRHKSIAELMLDKELSELEGVALNTKEELPDTIFGSEETAFFKQMTSGDSTEVTSGKKYNFDVTFMLTTHFVFGTNVEVVFSNFTQAVFNRILYIGLRNQIPPERRIRNLNELLRAELSGIIAVLLPVLQRLWGNHFQFTRNAELNSCTDSVVGGNLPPALPIAQNAVGGDGLDRFIKLKLQPANGDAKLAMGSLYQAYTGWAAQNGAGQFKDQGKFTVAFKKAIRTGENESLYHDVVFCKATFPGYTNQISGVRGVTFRDTSC